MYCIHYTPVVILLPRIVTPGYEATIVTHSALAVSRQPVAYVAWEPTKAEIELLRENPKRRKVEPGSTIGEDIRITNLKMSTTFSMR